MNSRFFCRFCLLLALLYFGCEKSSKEAEVELIKNKVSGYFLSKDGNTLHLSFEELGLCFNKARAVFKKGCKEGASPCRVELISAPSEKEPTSACASKDQLSVLDVDMTSLPKKSFPLEIRGENQKIVLEINRAEKSVKRL